MPSCHQPADRGHLDHIVPARCDPATGKPTLGTTSAGNLAPPCPHHHLGKDAGRGFQLHRATDGTYTWTTPLGRTYSWRPEPHWHQATDAIPDPGLPGIPTRAGPAAGVPARADPAAGVPVRPDRVAGATEGIPTNGGGDAFPKRSESATYPEEVPVCDCPTTCACQSRPDPASADDIVDLIVPGDADDHCAAGPGDATGPEPDGAPARKDVIGLGSAVEPKPDGAQARSDVAGPDCEPMSAATPHADDPPPF